MEESKITEYSMKHELIQQVLKRIIFTEMSIICNLQMHLERRNHCVFARRIDQSEAQ